MRPSGSERSCEHSLQSVETAHAQTDHDQVVIAAAHAHQRFLERVDRGNFVGRLQSAAVNQATDSGRSSITRMRPDGVALEGFRRRIEQTHALAGRLAHAQFVGHHLQAHQRLRTRANSAASSTGLVRKSSAPASSPVTRSARLIQRGDHHDGHMRGLGIGLDAAADFEPVHARHHDVKQHDVGFALVDLGKRFRPLKAVTTSKYSAVSLASSSLTFERISSTTRTRAVMAVLTDETANGIQEARDRYRFGDIGFAAALANHFLVAFHGESGDGDDRNSLQRIVFL